MSAPIVIKSTDSGVPVLSGTEGSLAALIRYIAPLLGWSIIYDGGTVIVVQPQSYKGGQALLYRFDDRAARGGAAPRVAKVEAYESMSDINTGSGLVGPVYQAKSSTADSTSKLWRVIGDAYGFYLFTIKQTGGSLINPTNAFYYGFANGLLPNDLPPCIMAGCDDSVGTYALSRLGAVGTAISTAFDFVYAHKDRSGALNKKCAFVSAGSLAVISSSAVIAISTSWPTNSTSPTYTKLPYPFNGQLLYYPVYMNEGVANTLLCSLPGFFGHMHRHTSLDPSPILPLCISDDYLNGYGPISFDNKTFMHYSIMPIANEYQYSGAVLIDIGTEFRP